MTITVADLISPERVREIAEEVDGNYYDMGWTTIDVGMKAIELATPEIAAAALEMAANACEQRDEAIKAAESQPMFGEYEDLLR
ncbi:MAG TPA: hypothetical protein VF077_13225 [Nitrospiraceae bacterium]